MMPSEVRKSRTAFIFAAWIAAGLLIVIVNRPLFVLINGIQWPPLDWAMLSATHLGNGAAAAMLVLLISPFRRDLTLRTAVAMILAGVVVHIIKDYASLPRPPALIGDSVRVLGPKLMSKSLPSGHTATAFALASSLKGSVDRRIFRMVLIGAVLVGISRIYVGAHFPVDAALGALVGWASAAAIRCPADYLTRFLDGRKPWLDGFFLFLAALCSVYLAFFEPMVRYNPWFLRPFGLAGLGASLYFLAKVPTWGRGEA